VTESLPEAFRTYVGRVIAEREMMSSDWVLADRDGTVELLIPKTNPDGFDVTVVADEQEVSVYSHCLVHRHYTSDGNHSEIISAAMGLTRDLLSPNMRVHVFEVGGSAYKAAFEAFHDGRWVSDGSTALFVIPWFRRRTERFYSNRRLPARSFKDNL
jgi:hypothetical protein